MIEHRDTITRLRFFQRYCTKGSDWVEVQDTDGHSGRHLVDDGDYIAVKWQRERGRYVYRRFDDDRYEFLLWVP